MRVKTTLFWTVVAAAVCLVPPTALGAPGGMTEFFPDLDGWTKDGDPEPYSPDNLFEYIDGAADVYLSYAFEELAMVSYGSGEKRSLTVEIYRHRELRDAFGIYSQERPQKGNFVSIGTEGYYDKGVLNFFHGRYYVKVTGFYLGEDDERTLTTTAGEVAKRLGGEPAFPAALACFPPEGKIAHTERFLALDVLGYGFLHSAYASDYDIDGSTTRVFIIEGKDESDAQKMFDGYVGLAGKNGPVVVENGICRFDDPLRSSGEPMNLRIAGRFVCGLFMSDAARARSTIDAIEKNLRAHRLIE